MKKAILDALMYAWVRGWYAGQDGQRTDDGKRTAASEIFRKLMKDLGLHEDAEHDHLWGSWIDSVDKPGQQFKMCDKCGEIEYQQGSEIVGQER